MVTSLAAFLAVATLLIIAPGPDTVLVVRNTVRRGRAGGLVTAAGTLTGLSLWALAAALGLSRLVQASQLGYDALRVAGAAYLVWLGIASLCARDTPREGDRGLAPAQRDATERPVGLSRLYAMGTVSNVLNPKIGVFFVAFLPGFIPAGAPVGATSALLGMTFVVETGLWLALLSTLVSRGADWLRRPRVLTTVERLTGAAMVGFGVRLAAQVRAIP